MSALSSSGSSGPLPAEQQAHETPALDTLVDHLIAAKKSLSSINHVWRANEIVTAARSTLEETVVVSARTGFLRNGLNNQLRLLYSVRAEVEQISLTGRSEFNGALKSLDEADARLKKTLGQLRDTIVHASFRPEGEDPKSLHDFVDERGVEELHATLKNSIDRINAAQAELDSSNRNFDGELQSIKKALGTYRAATKLASSRSSVSSSGSQSASNPSLPSLSSMPSMVHSLEMHAQEMAKLLESLVAHFDQCVNAVKHTEGGGAAAQSITGDLPAGVIGSRGGQDVEGDIANMNAPLDPLSDSHYREMVNVIINDAAEAEDVVMEISDRIGEMESVIENLLAQRDSFLAIYSATKDVFSHLSSLASTRLPGYIAQAHGFTGVWNEEHDCINEGLANLSDLNALYDGFLDAYDGLIIEVARRRHVRHRVEKILREARHKLDILYDEDVNARETFRVDQGDYLPSDIWPGLSREPMRVEFYRITGGPLKGVIEENPDQSGENEPVQHLEGPGEILPDLPKTLVEQALARLKSKRNAITRQES
ncbi:autophagy-related protein 17 [Aspergillus karnatakaensis]|uniref:autophagy-related protein 17 n=1 Tax=Aspergillus karnatakaensis TaxID=1810916 RepID=UPI003CCE1637